MNLMKMLDLYEKKEAPALNLPLSVARADDKKKKKFFY